MLRDNLEISPEKFYGGISEKQQIIENLIEKRKNEESPKKSFDFMRRLLGPSQTWKVFRKQNDALEYCLKRRNGLMCFAFEDINNSRMFLVAHPKVFWASNHHRFFKNCNSYEIIPEFAVCKLYFDIEFDFECNPNCDGERMLYNFKKIINFNLNHYFGVKCSDSDILDLDSSNHSKFSRHIMYQIKRFAFQDNYNVGNFVKEICNELKTAYEMNLNLDNTQLSKLISKYSLSTEEILELFVKDKKSKIKLLVDEGVYTKNRHFRILGSSKQSKKVPLCISKQNKYVSTSVSDTNECSMFLDSLVTYFSWKVDKVLEFKGSVKEKKEKFILENKSEKDKSEEGEKTQPYPQIDAFIGQLIFPKGRVRRKIYFHNASRLIYEIQNFRYCENIKREHKSNNILYVVDLQNLVFYQKCYDSECSNFKSNSIALPEEIRFHFEKDSLDEDILIADNKLENEFVKFVGSSFNNQSFGDEAADEELQKIADCAEAVLDVNW